MNILLALNFKNLKLNKKRNIVTTIGITLSIALITCATTMFTSLKETARLSVINTGGDYHFSTNRISYFEKITKDQNIKHYYKVKQIANLEPKSTTSESTANQSTDPINIVGIYTINPAQLKLAGVKIVNGSAPKSADEAIISIFALDEMPEKYQLGSNIKIAELENREYKIVGFYETRSYAFGSPYGAGVSLITVPQPDQSDEVKNTTLYYSIKNLSKFEEYKKELYGGLSDEEIKNNGGLLTTNGALLNLEGIGIKDSAMAVLLAIFGCIIAIIMFTSIFVIKNSFAISATEKIKEFGILKSLGATTKQIKRLIMLEGCTLGVIGAIFGVMLGIIANFILIHIVNFLMRDFISEDTNLVIKVSFLGIIAAILTGAITIYLSIFFIARRAKKISAIESIKSSEDIKINIKKLKTPKIIGKIFGIGGIISYKNLKRNRKKYRTTVFSITISVVAFISMSYIVSVIFGIANNTLKNVNYNYGITFNQTSANDKTDYFSIAQQISKNILNEQNTTVVAAGKYIKIETADIDVDALDFINQHNSWLSDEKNRTHDMPANLILLDDTSFDSLLKKNHLNQSTKILIPDLITITSKSEFRVTKVLKSDKINFTQPNLPTALTPDATQEAKPTKTFTLDVAKIKEMPIGFSKNIAADGQVLNFFARANDPDFHEMLDNIGVAIFANTKNAKAAEKSTKEFLDKQRINKRKYIQFGESIRALYNIMLIIQIFGYGFIAVITLIGLTNIFNTIHTNMLLRRREFAILRSVGITKKELNRIVALESLFYGFKSLFLGVVIGIAASYGLYKVTSTKEPIPYYPPITAAIISIVSVLFVLYIIMQYSIRSANKQNIIETIRNENI